MYANDAGDGDVGDDAEDDDDDKEDEDGDGDSDSDGEGDGVVMTAMIITTQYEHGHDRAGQTSEIRPSQ